MKTNKEMENLFNELVPIAGKADTVAGEIVRAYTRLRKRFYNDGDMVDIEEGKEMCNPPARYLRKNSNQSISNAVHELWINWYAGGTEADYERKLDILEAEVLDYIGSNPQLKTTPNDVDMWDFYIRDEDEWYDCFGDDDEEYWGEF